MSKMSKTIAALGVAAGLGVAAMPLSSYAAVPEGAYSTTTQAQVEVVVEGAITISSNVEAGKTVSLGNIMPGKMSAASQDVEVTVSSNAATEYDLYIHALNNGEMVGKSNGSSIPNAAPADNGNTSGWGYAYSEEAFATDPTTFTALPTEATKLNTAAALATVSADGTAKPSNVSHFKFAASANKTQTADTYTGTVIFTAVVE